MVTRAHDDAVSSVVGTILMLAVTVSVFGGLSIVVLNEVRSAEKAPDADVAFVSDGNRAILVHRGGEAITLADGFVLLNVNGAEVRFDLTDLADQTADGKTWHIGETLCLSGPSPPDPSRPCLLDDLPILGAAVVVSNGLIAEDGERGGDAGACPLDNDGPSVPDPWTFDPADVLSTTSGDVTVRFTAIDDCAGVDATVPPQLHFRVNDGSGPAFTTVGAMASEGGGVFSGTVPAQSWNVLGGQVLQVYASGLQDLGGNVGADTAVQDETIDAVTLVAYVSLITPTMGAAGAIDPAQDDADGEAATTLDEAGTLGSPGSGGPTKFSGTTQVSNGAVNAGTGNALTSDDVRVEFDTTGDSIEASGFGLPASTDSVTAVTIGYEGRKASTGGTSPTTRLDYKIGAGAWQSGTSITESNTVDADRTRSLCATATACTTAGLTVAGVESMSVRVYGVAAGTRLAQVDHVFATVTYTTAAQTTYSMEIVLDFAGASDGASETLELRHQASGDTFRVDVWDGVGYTSRGILSSATFDTFSYVLTAAEFNAGAPRIRLVDVTPSGTAAGSLQLDYARVVTL